MGRNDLGTAKKKKTIREGSKKAEWTKKYSPNFLTRLHVIYLRRTVKAHSQMFSIHQEPDAQHDTIGTEDQLVPLSR